GCAQPLEILGQVALEAVALLGPVFGLVARAGHFDMERGHRAVLDVEPVVLAPIGFLDRGFPAQYAAAFLGGRATAEMDEISLAVRCIDDVAMAGALDGGEG